MEPNNEITITDCPQPDPDNHCPVHTDLLVLANIHTLNLDLSDRIAGPEADRQ